MLLKGIIQRLGKANPSERMNLKDLPKQLKNVRKHLRMSDENQNSQGLNSKSETVKISVENTQRQNSKSNENHDDSYNKFCKDVNPIKKYTVTKVQNNATAAAIGLLHTGKITLKQPRLRLPQNLDLEHSKFGDMPCQDM